MSRSAGVLDGWWIAHEEVSVFVKDSFPEQCGLVGRWSCKTRSRGKGCGILALERVDDLARCAVWVQGEDKDNIESRKVM